jgi:hypothetical protein
MTWENRPSDPPIGVSPVTAAAEPGSRTYHP